MVSMGYQGTTLILLYIAITSVSVLVTYLLSIAFRHANAFFPYLSYLGDKPPESTVFTQCFVVDAAALLLIIQIRFVQAFQGLTKKKAPEEYFRMNLMGVYAGYVAAVALFVLSCFQESNAYYVHHFGGVFFYFFGSLVYFTTQTIVSTQLASSPEDLRLLRMRITCNWMMIFFFLLFEIGYLISLRQFQKPWEDRTEWTWADGGFFLHVLSAFSEWMLVILYHFYFLTFYVDFKGVVLTKNRIVVTFNGENVSL